jgi:membrane protein DedA with SNARE-associated domain
MQETELLIREFLKNYGYHAVPFALLYDPAGIPWAWIFLMVLAEEAGKNIPFMLIYGFAVLMFFDHILYWIGLLGGRRFVRYVGKKRPDWKPTLKATRKNVRDRGALAVIFGRYLPFIGRWMGVGAGMSGMNYLRFSIYDAIGAALSAFGFGLVAHFVGRQFINWPYFTEILAGLFVGGLLLGIGGAAMGWYRKRKKGSSNKKPLDKSVTV